MTKFREEIRNSNLEIRNNGPMSRLGHSGFGFRICFEIRYSYFEFTELIWNDYRSSIVALMVVWGLIGCAPDTVTIKTHPKFFPDNIKKVAVMPFEAVSGSRGVYQTLGELPTPDVAPSEIRQSFEVTASPVPDRPHATTLRVPSVAAEKITHMIYSDLRLRSGLQTIAPETVRQVLSGMGVAKTNLETKRVMQQLGKKLALDAVVHGSVRVYRERASKIGGVPAAVGFDVRLISARDGTVLWVGDYFEEQKPLTEDLKGFLERGGKFVTAEELARSGVNRVLERLPLGKNRDP